MRLQSIASNVNLITYIYYVWNAVNWALMSVWLCFYTSKTIDRELFFWAIQFFYWWRPIQFSLCIILVDYKDFSEHLLVLEVDLQDAPVPVLTIPWTVLWVHFQNWNKALFQNTNIENIHKELRNIHNCEKLIHTSKSLRETPRFIEYYTYIDIRGNMILKIRWVKPFEILPNFQSGIL